MKSPRLLNDLFSHIAEVGHSLVSARPSKQTLGDLCAALLSGRGEATGLALAGEIFARYAALSTAGKHAFFLEAAHRFGVDENALAKALAASRHADGRHDVSKTDVGKHEVDKHEVDSRMIHFASEPRSQELMRRLNRAPGGTRALVTMRADLLTITKQDASLKHLDMDFRHLLASWFNRGFLELRRIDWSSSAEVLEKIIAYEAVHAINGWDDLRLRVAAPDRRLYAFFHPALADDPLIFVEVALTIETPTAISPILAGQRALLEPNAATAAVFYSISNCQVGLRGISFGSFLIKQVVEELQGEFKDIKTFATLSPVSGLRNWTAAECEYGESSVLTAAQRASLLALTNADSAATGTSATDEVAIVERGSNDIDDSVLREVTARYLLDAKAADGAPLDRVARFHLGNGARLEWINVGADRSSRGIHNYWGVMVNYVYDLSVIERNHEAFANHGKIICAPAVRRLLKKSG